jgi:hypothetical protein
VFHGRLPARRTPSGRGPPRQPADLGFGAGQDKRSGGRAGGRNGGSLGGPSDWKGADTSRLLERTDFYSSSRAPTVLWCPCKVSQLMPGERREESLRGCFQPAVAHSPCPDTQGYHMLRIPSPFCCVNLLPGLASPLSWCFSSSPKVSSHSNNSSMSAGGSQDRM